MSCVKFRSMLKNASNMKTEHIHKIIRSLADGTLPAKYRNKVLRWLAADSNSKEKDEALFELWNQSIGEIVSSSEKKTVLLHLENKLGISSRGKKKYYSINSWLKYAAVFLLPLISGLTVWLFMREANFYATDMVECFVPNGELKQVILSDGTVVKLNSGTMFVYPADFRGEERDVFLSGEAYFDVARNEKVPFVVKTGRLNVKVLGTSFNVNAYPDNNCITTTLNSGKIKAYRSEEESSGVVMEPNDKLVYNSASNDFELSRIEASDYSSWTEGQIRFVKSPLSEMLKTLEHSYNVEFRYDDRIDLGELYTISFKLDEPIEQVMSILVKLMGNDIDYSIRGNIVYLNSARKGGKR